MRMTSRRGETANIFNAIAIAAATLLTHCAYDFDSICVEGEVCDPAALTRPSVGEPAIEHVAACRMLQGTCIGTSTPTACKFVISGNSVDTEPQCTTDVGSVTRDGPCSDAMECGIGLTCVRPSVGANGLCRDLCTTLGDCTLTTRTGETTTCDRSRTIATIGGVNLYACISVATDVNTR